MGWWSNIFKVLGLTIAGASLALMEYIKKSEPIFIAVMGGIFYGIGGFLELYENNPEKGKMS